MRIVIAWCETVRVPRGEARIDLGERPPLEDLRVPKAVVWLLDGEESDRVKAEAHAQTIEGAEVFTFPVTEKDPIGRAKRLVAA